MKRETTKNKKEWQRGVRAETVFNIRIHYLAVGIKKKDTLEYMMGLKWFGVGRIEKGPFSPYLIQRRQFQKQLRVFWYLQPFSSTKECGQWWYMFTLNSFEYPVYKRLFCSIQSHIPTSSNSSSTFENAKWFSRGNWKMSRIVFMKFVYSLINHYGSYCHVSSQAEEQHS